MDFFFFLRTREGMDGCGAGAEGLLQVPCLQWFDDSNSGTSTKFNIRKLVDTDIELCRIFHSCIWINHTSRDYNIST